MRGWFYFAFVQLVSAALTIIGWVLLLPLSIGRCWHIRASIEFQGRQVEVWRGGWLTWIWGNEEDGVIGNAIQRARFKDERLCAYYWSAIRNPTNNLRFVFRWVGGPFCRREWRSWYVQAGWNTSGYPVLSAGRT